MATGTVALAERSEEQAEQANAKNGEPGVDKDMPGIGGAKCGKRDVSFFPAKGEACGGRQEQFSTPFSFLPASRFPLPIR